MRSESYARARLFTGALFVALGATVFYRTLAASGVGLPAIPGCVLGAAMMLLGIFRFRDYLAARARR